ncbi:MAG: Anhydro-N-acetylmuramic acid kinase [Holosporales bacterium]
MNTSKTFFSIGLMSGTSMDSVDAALIETDGNNIIRFIDATEIEYPVFFKKCLKEAESFIASHKGIFRFDDRLKESNKSISTIIEESTFYHLKAIDALLKKQKHKLENFIIGYHGQTFYHQPLKNVSIILGNPQTLVNYFKQCVIFNFRENDILNGGYGAPLAPLYHFTLAKQDGFIPCAVINCGGISNITVIPSQNMENVTACDIGPGNTLLDRFILIKTNGKEYYDKDGCYSTKGKLNQEILTILFQQCLTTWHSHKEKSPKSLDVNDFVLPNEILNLSIEDGAKTLATFTALLIASNILNLKKDIKMCIGAGGGVLNPTIFKKLKEEIEPKGILLKSADDVFWRTKSLEAELFAYLAVRSYLKLPISFPNTTGVKKPLSGGDIYMPKFG